MESISVIREKFRSADEAQTDELILMYAADERSGVQDLIRKANAGKEKLRREQEKE